MQKIPEGGLDVDPADICLFGRGQGIEDLGGGHPPALGGGGIHQPLVHHILDETGQGCAGIVRLGGHRCSWLRLPKCTAFGIQIKRETSTFANQTRARDLWNAVDKSNAL
jgi:hypothetical protein